MRDYRKIEAWQLADDLAVAIYRLSNVLPREEIYGLTSQMRRSAVSVAANIVEGSARETKGDYLHFLHIARGSLAETRHFIHLTPRLEYVPESDANAVEELSRRAYACLHGLIKAEEKDAGKPDRLAATVKALAVLGSAHLSLIPAHDL